MSHSLIGADRGTHLKIVAVALIAAATVVGIGSTGRIAEGSTPSAGVEALIFRAGNSQVYASSGYSLR
jgi:hypothetical protein